jgi:hypothetical protein
MLEAVARGEAETAHIGALRALARRGLIKLDVRTIRYPERGRTVKEVEVRSELTPAGQAMLQAAATETALRIEDRDARGRKLDRSEWITTVTLRGVVLYRGSDPVEIAKASRKAGLVT